MHSGVFGPGTVRTSTLKFVAPETPFSPAVTMVSYVVTGANRGIGLAFVQALQARLALRPPSRLQKRDSQDAVFAIVQDLDSCGELRKLADSNVHIIRGDLDKPGTLHVRAANCFPDEICAEQGFSPPRPRLQKLPEDRWMC